MPNYNNAPTPGSAGPPGLPGQDETRDPYRVRTVTASTTAFFDADPDLGDEVILVDASAGNNIQITLPGATAAANPTGQWLYVKRIDQNPLSQVFITTFNLGGLGTGGDDVNITLAPTSSHGQKSGEGVFLVYSADQADWQVLTSNQNVESGDYQKHLAHTGTDRSWNPATLKVNWSGRWVSIGSGFDTAGTTDQFINIPEPAVGTVILVDGVDTGITWQADGVTLQDWQSLSYKYEEGSGIAGAGSFWNIRNWNDFFERPESEIVIAQHYADTRDAIKWGDGVWSDATAAVVEADFFREGGSGYTGLPAGTAADESTTTAVRRAPTGFGWTPGNTAVAKVDINGNNLRTGVANTAVGSVLYATGSLPALSFASGAITTQPPNQISFGHFNQTAGIGVAYNGFYSTGSAANQDFVIQNKGTGQMSFNHQAILGNHAYTNHTVGFAPLAGQGWYERWYGQNALHMLELRQRSATGAGLGYETINHTKNSNGGLYAALSLSPTPDSVVDHYLKVGAEGASEIKLSVWGTPNAAGTSAFGLGLRSSALLVRAANPSQWITMAASSTTEIARFRGQGYLQMNPLLAAGAPFGPGMIYWGEAGGNQRPFINGLPGSLHFGYSNAPNSLVVTPNRVRPAMPVYANEAAAAAEVTGILYRTATGEVRVKL